MSMELNGKGKQEIGWLHSKFNNPISDFLKLESCVKSVRIAKTSYFGIPEGCDSDWIGVKVELCQERKKLLVVLFIGLLLSCIPR